MACLSAVDALAIDTMLPALAEMSADLGLQRDNDRQFIITSVFLGFAFGLIAYGILGDSLGRKRPILIGIVIFLAGTAMCGFATDLPSMIAGRVVQGLGAAGPYVLSLAIVRDVTSGRAMARVMSLIMMIFVLIPAIAPLIGQGILLFTGWRSIFILLAVFAIVTFIWFTLRQPETLPPEKRVDLSLKQLLKGSKEVLTNRVAMIYALCQSCILGAFLMFLSTAQQIYQDQYGLGVQFPVYFALLALTLGVASYYNSRWVMQLGMLTLVSRFLILSCIASAIFLAFELTLPTGLPFWGLMVYMMVTYFCCGILFGNFTSLAMQPLGHIAGVASAVLGFIETMVALILGTLIASLYNGTLVPLIAGFLVLTFAALLLALSVKSVTEDAPDAPSKS